MRENTEPALLLDEEEFFVSFNWGSEPVLCKRCGRQLTDEASKVRKIGPECLQKGEENGE